MANTNTEIVTIVEGEDDFIQTPVLPVPKKKPTPAEKVKLVIYSADIGIVFKGTTHLFVIHSSKTDNRLNIEGMLKELSTAMLNGDFYQIQGEDNVMHCINFADVVYMNKSLVITPLKSLVG